MAQSQNSKRSASKHSNNKKRNTNKAPRENINQNIRKMVPWGIGTFIVILLIILFFLLKNFNSPEAQAKIFVNAVKNNDTQRIANILSTRDNKVGSDEAETYIKYIKHEIGLKKFNQELNDTVHDIDKKDKDADYIKTPDGNNVLRVTMNGRRYIFFDNIGFATETKKAIIKKKAKTTYVFRTDDKKRKVIAEPNETTMFGYFIPGNYKIPATKENDNGKFVGYLTFSFKGSNSETVDVHENFPEANLNVELDGAEHLDNKNTKVKINGKQFSYDNTKLYGPYPVTDEIEVSAEGKVKGKTFKSETVKLYPNELKANTPVRLKFEKDKIDKYVKEKEKEENSLKNKVNKFFDKYTSALNTAAGANNFSSISNFLKPDTQNYKSMKQSFQTGQGTQSLMQNPQVVDVSQDGSDIYAEVLNINNQGIWVTSKYKLEDTAKDSKKDGDDSDLKIVSNQE